MISPPGAGIMPRRKRSRAAWYVRRALSSHPLMFRCPTHERYRTRRRIPGSIKMSPRRTRSIPSAVRSSEAKSISAIGASMSTDNSVPNRSMSRSYTLPTVFVLGPTPRLSDRISRRGTSDLKGGRPVSPRISPSSPTHVLTCLPPSSSTRYDTPTVIGRPHDGQVSPCSRTS